LKFFRFENGEEIGNSEVCLMSRKPRKCRICKKRPVWIGGDVKNPGPFCKQCYHKKASPDREAARRGAAPQRETHLIDEASIPEHLLMDPDFYYWHFVRDVDD
jgi:hypothetical protein